MKKYKTGGCECGCAGELTLSKGKNKKTATIQINNAPITFGLYKLLRIKDWLGGAITEIEKQK